MRALEGMAQYHKDHKEWVRMTECCEEALTLTPKATLASAPPEGSARTASIVMGEIEERLLLMLADAAEEQGDMRGAHEYDEKAKKVFSESGKDTCLAELEACNRREAIELLAAGRPREACSVLRRIPQNYADLLESSGLNFSQLHMLRPMMAALKVLATALAQTGVPIDALNAGRIRADVQETEAILAGYWEGVLEETRRDLREQRQAATVAVAAAAKKKKTAKRKQLKRKAQQQKKAAELAEATGAVGGGDGTQGQEEIKKPAEEGQDDQEEEQERQLEGVEDKGEGERHNQQAVTATAAALTGLALGGSSEKDECSVCLNVLDGDDAENPAGPPLVCGHRYHAFCLHFWVEKCTSKCIEPTCPYCRAPLQEKERV